MEVKLAEYLLTLSYFSRITAASKSCKKLQIGTCTNLKCSIVRGEEGNERCQSDTADTAPLQRYDMTIFFIAPANCVDRLIHTGDHQRPATLC